MDIISYLEEKHHIRLNEQQKQGVLEQAQNVLLLAVPGSGKTTVLVARIAHHLLNQGVPGNRILTLTFNRETAREIKRRFTGLFGDLTMPPHFSTIHSFCCSVLRHYAQAYHREVPRLLSNEGGMWARLLRDIYKAQTGDFLTEELLEELDRRIGKAKNLLQKGEELNRDNTDIKNFPSVFAAYESYKRQNGIMDFDDMLTLTLDIFQRCPRILAHFRKAYDEINIDEAQDTSLVQHKIIALLSEQSRIFMVGDEDQSIYSFRGAYPKALLSFSEVYPNARIIKMEQNFRSGMEIVRHADRFIRQNCQRYEKEMFCRTTEMGKIEWLRLPDYARQYQQALQILRDLPPGKTAAVLYRNNESAVPLIDLLHQNKISFYNREHRLSFFTSSVIRDLSAYFILGADLRDQEAFSQIAYKLKYSKGVAEYVKDHAAAFSDVFECILSLPSLNKTARSRTVRYREKFPKLCGMDPVHAIAFVRRELGYDDYLENRITDSGTRALAGQKLNAAVCLAKGETDIFSYMEKLEHLFKDIETRRGINPEAPVTLSTIHSAKGMEFDWVILLDILKDILPSDDACRQKRQGNPDDYEGEVRLFYVGVTRAKERLIAFQSHRQCGLLASPSVFLEEFIRGNSEKGEKSSKTVLPEIVGRTVYHVIFGDGTVLSQEGEYATIAFRWFGEKRLSLPVCLDGGILRVK